MTALGSTRVSAQLTRKLASLLRERTALPLGGLLATLLEICSSGQKSYFHIARPVTWFGIPLLQNPTVSIRIEKIGEARVVSARRIEPCGVASNPSIYRGFVPNGTDLDAIFQQSIPRRLEVGHEKTTATKRAGERIPNPVPNWIEQLEPGGVS